MKLCKQCQQEKPLDDFHKRKSSKDGRDIYCKQCKKEQDRLYREKNKDKIAVKNKEWAVKNKEKSAQIKKEWNERNREQINTRRRERYASESEYRKQRASHGDSEKKKAAAKARYERIKGTTEHKAKVRQRVREYYQNNDNARIAKNLRKRLWEAVNCDHDSTLTLLGCTIDELRSHLESLWTEGMTWDNYGKNGWHIDHIRPCASFDLTDPKQIAECFHYSNLQPLWEFDNLSKGAKYD